MSPHWAYIHRVVQLQSMVPSPAPDSSSGNTPKSNGDIFKIDQKPTLAPIEQTATERLERLMRDCGYSTDRLQSMYEELPPRKMRDDLVDYYFSAMSVLVSVTAVPIAHVLAIVIGVVIQYRSMSSALPTLRSLEMNTTYRTLATFDFCLCYSWC